MKDNRVEKDYQWNEITMEKIFLGKNKLRLKSRLLQKCIKYKMYQNILKT